MQESYWIALEYWAGIEPLDLQNQYVNKLMDGGRSMEKLLHT